MFTTTLLYNSQDMEATQVTINRQTDEDVVHIYNGILLSHKKSGIFPLAATWMNLKCIMLSEISQTKKDKYCIISLRRGI